MRETRVSERERFAATYERLHVHRSLAPTYSQGTMIDGHSHGFFFRLPDSRMANDEAESGENICFYQHARLTIYLIIFAFFWRSNIWFRYKFLWAISYAWWLDCHDRSHTKNLAVSFLCERSNNRVRTVEATLSVPAMCRKWRSEKAKTHVTTIVRGESRTYVCDRRNDTEKAQKLLHSRR